jgi:hypothetical protein
MPHSATHPSFEFHIDQLSSKQKAQLWMRLLSALGATIFLIFLMAAFMYRFKMFVLPKYQSSFLDKVAQALPGPFKPSPRPSTLPKGVPPVPSPKPISELIISRQTATGSATILHQWFMGYPILFGRWENNLVWTEKVLQADNTILISLMKQELTSGATTKVAEVTKSNDGYGVHDLEIIDDYAYLAVSGDTKDSGLYRIDLSKSESKPQLIFEYGNPKIEKIDKYYFLTTGFGDGCGGHRNYSLLDSSYTKATEIMRSHHGCDDGDEFIGIDYRGRMVTAYHEVLPAQNIILNYLNMSSITLDASPVPQGLIARQNMPAAVRVVTLSDDKKKVILVGDTISTYNLETNELKELAVVPQELLDEPAYVNFKFVKDSQVCVIFQGKKGLLANWETGEISLQTPECEYHQYNDEDRLMYEREERIKATMAFEALALPATYELSFGLRQR